MRSNLAVKIFVCIVLFVLGSLAVTSTVVYVRASAELKRSNEDMMTQIVDNALHHTDLYLEKYDRATLSIMTSANVKEFLEIGDSDVYQYYAKSKEIIEQVIRPVTINNPEIAMVYLLGYNGKIITDLNIGTATKESVVQESLESLQRQTREDGRMTVMNESFLDGTVALTRKIADRQTSKAFKGILGIEISTDELNTLWQGIHLGDSGYFFIVNERGTVIYYPDRDKIGKQLDGELYTSIVDHRNSSFTSSWGGEERVYYSKQSDYSGWTLVTSVAVSEVRKPILSIRLTTILSAMLTCLLALLIAYNFGKSITKPIQMLVAAMRETEKGRWTPVPLLGKRDERDRLIQSYNVMVGRLAELVDQVYKSELENKNNLLRRKMAEFQALQLQINPHFLYNTLETVVSYAIIQDSREIREIVRSMAYMLRYAVRTRPEEVTVALELKHVLHYMTIMNHRFERPFELTVAVPAGLLLHNMVSLTLQPVIENAFKHAFPQGHEAYHFIRIDARAEEDLLLIEISDNGAGMSAERLTHLRRRLAAGDSASEKEGGIGLANVHGRIQMTFGERYGLTVESGPDRGTSVLFRMPWRSREDSAVPS